MYIFSFSSFICMIKSWGKALYNRIVINNSLSSFQILYSHPCSLQILHEDEASSSHAPPPPLAAFGGIGPKLTATELRRTRMMNKQMSEDCAPARRPASSGHYDEGSRRSLQNATESCEMRDMTGRSMHDRKATTRQSIRGIKKQYSLALSDAAV